MKEEWSDLDKFNEQLGESLDVNSAWNDYNNKKKKRKPFWWIFFGGSMLIAILVIFIKFMPIHLDQSYSENIDTDTELQIQQEIKKKDSEPNTNSIRIRQETQQAVTEDISIKEIRSELNKNIQSDQTKTEATNQINNKKILTKFNQQLNSEFNNTTQHKATNIETKNNFIEPKSRNSLPIENSENKKAIKLKLVDLVFVPTLDMQLRMLDTSSQLTPQELTNDMMSSTKNQPSIVVKYPMSLTFNYSLSQTNREINSTLDPYTLKRMDHEQMLESNSFELFITKQLNSKLSLSSGLNYNTTRAKSVEQIQSFNPVELESQIVNSYVQNGNISDEEIGTLSTYQVTNVSYIKYHRYTNISIPLLLDLKIVQKNQWSVHLNGGLSYQIFGKVSGYVFDSALPNGLYKPLSDLLYRNFGLISARSGLHAKRGFTNGYSASLGIAFESDLNSRRKTSTSSVEKFEKIGIQFGLSRNF